MSKGIDEIVVRMDKYDRMKRLQAQIEDIKATVYPDRYEEVKETMLKALCARIDQILRDEV